MINKHSVDHHPSPSSSIPKIHPLIFLYTPYGFTFLLNICWIFSKSCISHHGWQKFSNLWGSDYWKMLLQDKKINLDNFTNAPRQNSPPGPDHHPFGIAWPHLPLYEIFQKWLSWGEGFLLEMGGGGVVL